MVPADDPRGREAHADPLRRLLLDHRVDVASGRPEAREQLPAVAGDLRRVALDLDVALHHHAAQLVVLLAVLDLQRRARITLEVPGLLRLPVGPAAQLDAVDRVPERHQMRSPVRADRRAGDDAMLREELAQLVV